MKFSIRTEFKYMIFLITVKMLLSTTIGLLVSLSSALGEEASFITRSGSFRAEAYVKVIMKNHYLSEQLCMMRCDKDKK